MRNETVVSNAYQLANKSMGLDPASFPDFDILLNFNEWANETFVINLAPVQVDRLDHRNVAPEIHINDASRAKLGLTHDRPVHLI